MALAPQKELSRPDYHSQQAKLKQFLSVFTSAYERNAPRKYMEMLQQIANRKRVGIDILLDDVVEWANAQGDVALVKDILANTKRYLDLFCKAIDSLMPEPDANAENTEDDIEQIWATHRAQRRNIARENSDSSSASNQNEIPPELTRRYELRLVPRTGDKSVNLRAIKASSVGTYVSMKAIVTRVSDVQPMVSVATYICNTCGHESYQTVNSKAYTPLSECPSAICKGNHSKGKLFQQTRGSKFTKYQELRLQEQPGEVPVGHIPRSMMAKCFGELTRKCVPGDVVTVSGMFLPSPYSGFRAIRAGLTADTYLHILHVVNHKKTNAEDENDATRELQQEVEAKSEEHDVYEQLAASIAPEIFGHEDIKKALILLLVSGVTRTMKDGMKIRGDINILLMGDPGVAKSQLLKHITRIAPRCVYTTGKGSSGVGLTAAVIRDQLTGEMTLEGGALVLADMGICCIDEFDKMEEGDRTAIHEVMEQQSVSIAKAGITTTLNARTAVLAAANPVYGRWNIRKPPEVNLGIETALLSRFDLCFIILDKPDEENDHALANHVTYVHKHNKHPPLDFKPFTEEFLRAYLERAKHHEPHIPKELTQHIVGSYITMRNEDNTENPLSSNPNNTQNRRQRFCTARSLLSILRLAQAHARLHFRDVVQQQDVDEAIRLIVVAKTLGEEEERVQRDPNSEIYEIIRRHAETRKKEEVRLADVIAEITRKGYSDAQVKTCISMYEDAAVWILSASADPVLRFLSI